MKNSSTRWLKAKMRAADDLLLEGLRLGAEVEQAVILNALINRKSVRGLTGIVERYESLPERLQQFVLANIKALHHALRECGRSDRPEVRQAAMRLIALSRECKLAYVLTENLHDSDEAAQQVGLRGNRRPGTMGRDQYAAVAEAIQAGG